MTTKLEQCVCDLARRVLELEGVSGSEIDAANITSGILPPARLSLTMAQLNTAVTNGEVAYTNEGSQFWTGQNYFTLEQVFLGGITVTGTATITGFLTGGLTRIEIESRTSMVTAPNGALALQVKSYGVEYFLCATDSLGEETFLGARPMTKAQRNAISSAPDSLIIYQTDNTPGFRFRENGVWVKATMTADP